MNILLFAGTTEGRTLAERLAALPVRATVCVATEYGGEALGAMPERFTVLIGRMDAEAMGELLRKNTFNCVIDATHPYAVVVSENIRAASAVAGIPCLRMLRAESEGGDCIRAAGAADAARALCGLRGNVLLTTGAKELAAFTGVPDFAERMYPRVLPTVESIRACEELGYRRSHIIAMQGPFGAELNFALMRQFRIEIVVTKDGGAEGGFPDKMLAAERAGAKIVVIGRPPESGGRDLDSILDFVRAGVEAET